jgi:hypothetical protein
MWGAPDLDGRARGEYGVSWIARVASLAFVLAQAFAAHGVRVAPYVRKE